MRSACGLPLGISIFFDGSVVVQQAEAVVRNRVHADVQLLFSALGRPQTQGLSGVVRLLRQEVEEL